MSERITVEEASEMLGMAPAYIRQQMRRGVLDIGLVMPSARPTGKKPSLRYYIYRSKVLKLMGVAE